MKYRLLAVALLVAQLTFSAHALDGEAASNVRHRIVRGNTLAKLARYYGISVEALRAANPGVDAQRLEVGATLNIPAPLNGWPLLTLESAQLPDHPRETLQQLNPGLDLNSLQAGQSLLVPTLEEPQIATAPTNASAIITPPATGDPLPAQAQAPVAEGDWELITLADGRRGWAPRALLLLPAQIPQGPETVIRTAQRFAGAPYVWGGQTPNGVDCSGFVHEVFRLSGHRLARLADEQFAQCTPVDDPQPGDLVFFSTYLPGPSHVGISLGGRSFLHASSSRGVIEASLDDDYFKSRYLGARRVPGWAQNPSARIP